MRACSIWKGSASCIVGNTIKYTMQVIGLKIQVNETKHTNKKPDKSMEMFINNTIKVFKDKKKG